MNETLTLLLAWVAGGVLGTIFFGGLWWTVRNGVSSKQPALWFLGSLLLRMSIAFIVTRFTGPPVEHNDSPAKEVSHAP
jgi:F1F0 ATPase subunit 2